MKLFLAPMASITDLPYRLLIKRLFGVDVVITELISSNGLCFREQKSVKLSSFHPNEGPVGAQIFGNDGTIMASAAKYLEDKGFNFIDINLGCPVPKVVKKNAGAGLCRNLDRLFMVLSEIKSILCIPLTIKIRLGWDEDQINAREIIKGAKELGIKWVAVHGRTRSQGYRGISNWSLLRELACEFPNYIIGNGDIRSLKDYHEYVGNAPFLGVMIGRAALSHPWIFQEIRHNRPVELERSSAVQILKTYQDYLCNYSSCERYVLLRLRKMAAWLSHGLPGAAKFRGEIFSADRGQLDIVIQNAARFFGCIQEDVFKTRPIESIYKAGEG